MCGPEILLDEDQPRGEGVSCDAERERGDVIAAEQGMAPISEKFRDAGGKLYVTAE